MTNKILTSALLIASGLNAASIQNTAAPGIPTTVLSPGGVFDFLGTDLCPVTAVYETQGPTTFPTDLANCTLNISGVRAPLVFVSPGKITFIAPDSTSGAAIVGPAGQTVNVTYAASTPRFVKGYTLNGVGIPVLQSSTQAIVGAKGSPIIYQKNNPGGNFLIATISGAGEVYSLSGGAGTEIAPGTTDYGWCGVLPVITLDGVALQYLTVPDGNGNTVPDCKQVNAFVQVGLEYTSQPAAGQPHTLSITGADGVTETSVVY
jgi:uncharacterized protein (TIGR03437 family)